MEIQSLKLTTMLTNEENNYINVELHACNVWGYIQ